jgi:hypothetical protein
MKTLLTVILFIVGLTTFIYSKSRINENYLEHSSKKCKVYKIPIINKNGLDGSTYIIIINKNQMSYSVSDKNETNNHFYINSNFFSNYGPIGEVKIDGKIKHPKKSGGGYFTSTNGIPSICFYKHSKNVKSSCQTHLIGVKNGVINNSICKTKWGKWKTHRILIGIDNQKNIVVIHSGNMGFLSIKDICKIGVNYGMVNGLLFDGGSSVEVGIKDGSYSHHFQSVSDFGKLLGNIHKPYTYIVGNFN